MGRWNGMEMILCPTGFLSSPTTIQTTTLHQHRPSLLCTSVTLRPQTLVTALSPPTSHLMWFYWWWSNGSCPDIWIPRKGSERGVDSLLWENLPNWSVFNRTSLPVSWEKLFFFPSMKPSTRRLTLDCVQLLSFFLDDPSVLSCCTAVVHRCSVFQLTGINEKVRPPNDLLYSPRLRLSPLYPPLPINALTQQNLPHGAWRSQIKDPKLPAPNNRQIFDLE